MEAPSILYIITKATHGGAQLYVRELALAAKEKGFRVAVAYGTPGRLSEFLNEDGIRGIPIPRLARDIRLLDEIRVFFDLIGILRTERPNTVNVNSSKAGGLGALAARLAGVRNIIYTAHGWPHKEPRPYVARALIWMLSWVTVLLSTKVIVVSEDDFRRAPVFFSRKKMSLIRNGIGNFSHLARDEARKAISSNNPGLDVSTPWILCLGELHRNKGFDILIRAFARIKEERPDVRVVVLGGGEQESMLRTVAHECGVEQNVHLAGFIPNGRNLLAAADLFLFPSRKEGLPFALLEAGRVGLPVIASNVGGLPEVIEHEKTGLLVPPENPDALADAMRTLLSDPERAKQYGTALKAHVEKEFSKERMVHETLALYSR